MDPGLRNSDSASETKIVQSILMNYAEKRATVLLINHSMRMIHADGMMRKVTTKFWKWDLMMNLICLLTHALQCSALKTPDVAMVSVFLLSNLDPTYDMYEFRNTPKYY